MLLFVCRGCLHCVAWFSYWFDNLGFITEGNTYRRCATSSLPLGENTNVVAATIKENFFKTLSRYVLCESPIKRLDLSLYILMQNIQAASVMSFIENSFSSILLCYPEILYHLPSKVCHLHIIWEMLQSSHSLSCKYRLRRKSIQKQYALINLSKRIFQVWDACTSP